MSRAFTKESDAYEVTDRPDPAIPPGVPNHTTPAGAAAFRARVDALLEERRELQGTSGGLSGSRLMEVEAEIRWLEGRIATFVVTEPATDPVRVGFGTRVTLTGDRDRVVEIVGVDEVEAGSRKISWLSPLAKALHGHEVGDAGTLLTPVGEEEWEIVKIEAI